MPSSLLSSEGILAGAAKGIDRSYLPEAGNVEKTHMKVYEMGI